MDSTSLVENMNIKTISLLAFCAIILSARPSEAGRYGIVILSNLEGISTTDIYRIPDATQDEVEQLTHNPELPIDHILVSKHGDEIIFSAVASRHVYSLNTKSKELTDLTNIFQAETFEVPTVPIDWSPDGKQFAIIETGKGVNADKHAIPGIMDINGANKDLLPELNASGGVAYAQWSPDGTELAFTQTQYFEDSSAIYHFSATYVYEIQSREFRQLTEFGDCINPKWSPSGDRIVVTCQTSFGTYGWPSNIYIIDAADSRRSYGKSLYPCMDPAWSPDGKQFAFVCQKVTTSGLFIINSDGTGRHEILLQNPGDPAFLGHPTWSPDGTQIVYVSGTDVEHTSIYSVDLDGSNNRQLTPLISNYQIIAVYPVH